MNFMLFRPRGPVVADAGGLHTAPSAEWEFLLGPQISTTTTISGLTIPPNMIEYADKRNQADVDLLISSPGFVACPGTVAVTNGSSTVTYTGTFADSGLVPSGYAKIFDTVAGIPRYFRVLSTNSGAGTAVLAGYSDGDGNLVSATWPGTTQSGLTLSKENPSFNVGGQVTATDAYATFSYYDTAHRLYNAWAYVDGFNPSSSKLALARQLVDHYVDSTMYNGLVTPGTEYGFSIYPRGSNLYSAICRAHDGRPELFAGIDAKVTSYIYTWLSRYQTGGPLASAAFTTRDGGYVLEFCALLGVVHPDTTRRNFFKDQAIALALDPCLRASQPTVNFFGTSNEYVRWMNYLNFDPDNDGFYDFDDNTAGMTASGVVDGDGGPVSQPFQDSLMLSGLRAVMQMMTYHGLDSGASWNTIRAGFIAGVRAWKLAYVSGDTKTGYGLARYISYWSGKNNHYSKTGVAEIGEPVDYSYPFTTLIGAPATFGVYAFEDGTDVLATISERQGNADGIVNCGYAYELTSESSFKTFMNEILDSCFAARYVWPPNEGGPNYNITGGDGRFSLYQDTQKNRNQHYGNGQITKALAYIYRADL